MQKFPQGGGDTFFVRSPRQPTITRYQAANIENEYSGAELAV